MKYPLHTQSNPVSGLAAKKLLEAKQATLVVLMLRLLIASLAAGIAMNW